MKENRICIENLTVEFHSVHGKILAVDDVSLELRHEEVSGIIGETGCGKSVMAMALLRLLGKEAYARGRLSLGTLNINDLKGRELRRFRSSGIALVPQNPSSSLNPVMKVQKQMKRVINALCRVRSWRTFVHRLFQSLGFPDPENTERSYPFQLSGGMRERILVSIGMVREPLWLLADEPTKGLDGKLRTMVGELLTDLISRRKGGIILITHDMDLARDHCDRIIVMYGASLMEDGTCDEVMKNPLHPYTKGLLQALPENGFQRIKGSVPGFGSLPDGCRFHPRCSHKMNICERETPDFYSVGKGRKVRCFLYAEG